MAGTLVSTRLATTFAFAQSGSMVAMRATLARTAMIFAARSDPRAIVLTATVTRLVPAAGSNASWNCVRGYNTASARRQNHTSADTFFDSLTLRSEGFEVGEERRDTLRNRCL